MVELDKKNIEQKLFSSDFTFEDSSVFKELMTLYPWCSSFTLVYLKSLSNTDDMRFPNELEEYAVQLNSREVIYDLIHGLDSKESVKSNFEESESNKDQKPELEGDTSHIEKHECSYLSELRNAKVHAKCVTSVHGSLNIIYSWLRSYFQT